MDEKIILLKGHLPEALVSNAGMYSILSRGIHSLSEEECLKYFDTIKLGIELILDEKIEQDTRRKKIKSVTDEIARIKGNLS
jgi:predicted ATPase